MGTDTTFPGFPRGIRPMLEGIPSRARFRRRRKKVSGRRVSIVTIGQYLRPSGEQLPVARFYSPQEFAALKQDGERAGIRHVESGPLVRSSYHAHEQSANLKH